MKNINLVKYGRFTNHIHKEMKVCDSFDKLEEVKTKLAEELKWNAQMKVFNADEYTRLRFRITEEYMGRLVEL